MKTWNFVKAAFGTAIGWKLGEFTYDFLVIFAKKLLDMKHEPTEEEFVQGFTHNDEEDEN